ncbi:hypothetical protein DPMN_175017 [Dreissena polymorpha]|uniref:G-protein coupled receptors family 1 profile domain-containing protein n=1 Tax=Dreissena polymorpha TaxID=45954 RepID=A0A9D4E726_DREPO|nr:hypothetical protein DPMN_175017 [Dreissena polymorpha]
MNVSGQTRDNRPLSRLLIALKVLFLVALTSVLVMSVYFPYLKEKLRAYMSVIFYTAWYNAQYIQFLYDVAVLVSFFNATFNFAIYVFSGLKFRAELRSLLCCKATQGTSLFGS